MSTLRYSSAGVYCSFILLSLAMLFPLRLMAQTVQTFNASGTWTAPAGVTWVTVEAWGAGGGGDSNGTQGGGGGGGGAYASATVTVVPGTTYSITVGAGGTAGVVGGTSQFDTGVAVKAVGGSPGSGNSGGAGGANGASVGTIKRSGGQGGQGQQGGGPARGGGGGGGSATAAADGGQGGAASGGTGGTGGTGAGGGGNGGNSGNNGQPGAAPGGGGGGAGQSGTGGPGASGRITLSYATIAAEYRFDELNWNGVAGEVIDSSANGFNASRGGGATTATGSPAYTSGSDSTCNYGRFDMAGTPRAHVQLPAGFPSLGSNFTITAWIRTTNANKIGQRIFVRDDNGNGWALSVSDEVAGTLRLFNRNIAYTGASLTGGGAIRAGNVALDTPVVFTNNVWYFVAVSVNVTNKIVTLYVYNAAGTQLAKTSASYTGTWGPGTGATSIGSETAASVENNLYFNGNIDEVRVYQSVVTQTQIEYLRTLVRTCIFTGFDHLRIEHAGSGVTCAPTSLTIKACADASCSSLYTGTVTGNLTATGTPTVNWLGGASFAIGATGWVTKDVQVTTAGNVTWGTSGMAPVASNGTTCYVGATNSCSFTSNLAGFLFDVPHHVSDTAQTITVSAVKQSDNSLACTPAFASTSKTINFGCTYSNPATGTLPVVVGGSNIACGSTSGIALAFNASGVASTTVRYADVGHMNLTASYTGSGGSEAGLAMNGSDNFIAAPRDFAIAPSGPYVAGVNFNATVTARNNSGNASPNFGRETTPEGVKLSFSHCQPTGVGTSAGSFSGSLGSFSNGAASATNLNWSEVGNGDLVAALVSGSYLGSGLIAVGNTGYANAFSCGATGTSAGNVGPFRPHHFDTQMTHGCSNSFTYSGQPFTIQVTAKNGLAIPTTTMNYSGTTTPAFAKSVTVSDANGTAGSWLNNVVAASGFSAGVASATPTFSFTAQPAAPAVLKPRATDADGVASALGTEGTTALRFGRLRLANAFGPASGALAMPAQAQYWSGSSWVLNGDDNCTTLPANAFFLTGGPAATTTASAVNLAGGLGTLTLTKSTTATGSVDVAANLGAVGSDQSCLATHGGTAANRPWLRSRNGNCTATYDRDPSARATFGIYSPETRRSVHVREVF